MSYVLQIMMITIAKIIIIIMINNYNNNNSTNNHIHIYIYIYIIYCCIYIHTCHIVEIWLHGTSPLWSMPGAEAPYPAPESSDRQIDWSLRPFTFHCQEISTPGYDSIFCHFGITNLVCFLVMYSVSLQKFGVKKCLRQKRLFSQTAMGKHLKNNGPPRELSYDFSMSQATHGSGRGALEARLCTQKKHCWEPKFKKKTWQSQQFQQKNPNTNPKINRSNSDNILSWFSR